MSLEELYAPIYRRLHELSLLTRGNLSDVVHASDILLSDLRNIVIEYLVTPDIPKAYRLTNTSHLAECQELLKGYDINIVVVGYNIYEGLLKLNKLVETRVLTPRGATLIKDHEILFYIENRFYTQYPFEFTDLDEIDLYIRLLVDQYLDDNNVLNIVESELIS